MQRYGPLHPELQQVDQQLSEIGNRLSSETSRIAASLETQAMVANGRTSSLQSSINQVEGTVMRQTAASVGLASKIRTENKSRAIPRRMEIESSAACVPSGKISR